jgi:DNA-binding XRE family transcriptional regulator
VTLMGQQSSEGVYGYIRGLREGRKLNQDELAEKVGIPYRTYVDFETRQTKELKTVVLVRVMVALDGDWTHLEEIVAKDLGEEGGRELAARRIRSPRPPHDANHLDISSIVAQAIAEIEAEDRQSFRQALTGWLAGWRASQRARRFD